MRKLIYKYPLANLPGVDVLRIPGDNAKPLAVGLQNNSPCIWIEFDPAGDPTQIEVECAYTGEAFTSGRRYLGTAGEHLVCHYYV